MAFLSNLRDLFNSEECMIITQKPYYRDPKGLKSTMMAHIAVSFAIYGLQQYYGVIGSYAPEEIPFWFMASGNMLVSIFGSVRGFDIVIMAELLVALITAVVFQFPLFFPVIIIMIIQTCQRLEKTLGYEFPAADEQLEGEEEEPAIRNRRHQAYPTVFE
ncbi:hypothetical protein GCK72_009057 [Caenorhabditis remanei]|uniref:Uncharacterized protein n=1 Tax=Caenorhabditis remanei TaxID=31234 RepID=A0A2P4VHL2_CAERE|nr:hypothetical protein GCK72_009057 [Caenorhabditis remanei]KAF1760807.1 hypothetical protein GCK72_009057 [Caenorhabditis remanei]